LSHIIGWNWYVNRSERHTDDRGFSFYRSASTPHLSFVTFLFFLPSRLRQFLSLIPPTNSAVRRLGTVPGDSPHRGYGTGSAAMGLVRRLWDWFGGCGTGSAATGLVRWLLPRPRLNTRLPPLFLDTSRLCRDYYTRCLHLKQWIYPISRLRQLLYCMNHRYLESYKSA
jgi:hypothetical protein